MAALHFLEHGFELPDDRTSGLRHGLELFEQGIRLSRECQDRLSQAERRIEVLMRDNQGRSVVSALEPQQGENNETDDESVF